MNNRQIWNFIIKTYLGWLVVILFITYYGFSVLPHMIGPGQLEWSRPSLDYWIRWSNWDGGHFRGIAEGGYKPFQAVFFPLYPSLIRTLMQIGFSSLWSGLIISATSTIMALYFLYRLVRLDFSHQIAQRTTLILLTFPTAFYLIAVYSESLLLALTLAAFYFARKKYWLLASLLAGLSAVTRLVGIGVILAIACEYFITNPPHFRFSDLINRPINRLIVFFGIANILLIFLKNILSQGRNWLAVGVLDSIQLPIGIITLFLIIGVIGYSLVKNLDVNKIFSKPSLWLLLSLSPLLAYLLFLNQLQGNPLAFISSESNWGRKLTLPWDPVVGYWTSLSWTGFLTIGPSAQILLELLFVLILLICLVKSLVQLRISYNIFFLVALVAPLFSGTLVAIHRYGLVIFPVMIILATINSNLVRQLWLFCSMMLLGLLSVLYINYFWVS